MPKSRGDPGRDVVPSERSPESRVCRPLCPGRRPGRQWARGSRPQTPGQYRRFSPGLLPGSSEGAQGDRSHRGDPRGALGKCHVSHFFFKVTSEVELHVTLVTYKTLAGVFKRRQQLQKQTNKQERQGRSDVCPPEAADTPPPPRDVYTDRRVNAKVRGRGVRKGPPVLALRDLANGHIQLRTSSIRL